MTNLRPSRTIFSIVIIVANETRVLWFTFGTFLGRKLRRILLWLIGFILPLPFLLPFDLDYHVRRLPHQISFLIQVIINSNNIHRTIINQGPSTCIMSVTCWKAIGSLTLSQSSYTLETFDGRDSHPFGILLCLPITLEGKTVEVEVKLSMPN